MLHINVRTNVEAFIRGFSREEMRQAKYAVGWALAATAENVRAATVDVMLQRFRASTPGRQWMVRHVKVLGNSRLARGVLPAGAAADRLRVFVGVIPPEGKGQFAAWSRYRRSLLPMMEQGGLTPGPRDFGGVIGYGRYPIPVRRVDDRARIALRDWPINLGLQARRTIAGPLALGGLQGKRRTYLVRIGPNQGMIFQRFGRARDDTMPLFYTAPQTRLPARRYFFPTAVRVVASRLPGHLAAAMTQATHGRGRYRALPTTFQGPALPAGWSAPR